MHTRLTCGVHLSQIWSCQIWSSSSPRSAWLDVGNASTVHANSIPKTLFTMRATDPSCRSGRTASMSTCHHRRTELISSELRARLLTLASDPNYEALFGAPQEFSAWSLAEGYHKVVRLAWLGALIGALSPASLQHTLLCFFRNLEAKAG